ncbi:MAG: hypothetical protein LBM99_01345 [Bacillales bacterium]|jgi:diacylglycerol kinase family enzyme|nr:hypothetical protein [Bacillales bacterium]
MIYILYNPLSNGNRGIKKLEKLKKLLSNSTEKVTVKNLLEIYDIKGFASTITADDTTYLIGGDGTFNNFINLTEEKDRIGRKLFLYSSGTGNDFVRNLTKNFKKPVDVTNKFIGFPIASFNKENLHFLNGVGLGVDGLVCHKVNTYGKFKTSFNYFKMALSAFFSFKRTSVTVTVDGVEHKYKKVWMSTVMMGTYIGGGMKFTPKQVHSSDQLTAIIVHNASLLKLLFMLPTIYAGKHTIFKRQVEFIKGREITIEVDTPQYLQMDGEVFANVSKFTARR